MSDLVRVGGEIGEDLDLVQAAKLYANRVKVKCMERLRAMAEYATSHEFDDEDQAAVRWALKLIEGK